MPTSDNLSVDTLHLDLKNYRTVPQQNEVQAVKTMISMKEDRFYALMNSILDNGYFLTENIIVLQDGKNIVKEGNRRVAALRIIFGYIKGIDLPSDIQEKIDTIPTEWKAKNSKIPCLVYDLSESEEVDKIVSQIHAKGEKAGRDKWTAVATARYNRDIKKTSEPALELLEKYLHETRNLSAETAERWSGDYPLTVLNEVTQKIFPLLKCSSSMDLSSSYPNKNKRVIDKIVIDIGFKQLTTPMIRDKIIFFGSKYGLTPPTDQSSAPPSTTSTPPSTDTSSKPDAYASNDPESVREKLKKFKPKGGGREKLVTLLDEMKSLNLKKHPHSFCFLLRSMFEISAKVYCEDHKTSSGPCATKPDKSDKSLKVLLDEITKYITKNNADKEKAKLLHGAITELAKSDSVLSVTSMNQLVHNPNFSVKPNDISVVFNNIFPLLEEMNK